MEKINGMYVQLTQYILFIYIQYISLLAARLRKTDSRNLQRYKKIKWQYLRRRNLQTLHKQRQLL